MKTATPNFKTIDPASEAQAEQRLKKRRTRWGCCLMGCSAPLSLLLMVVIAAAGFRQNAISEWELQKAEIQAAGEPFTIEELNTYYAALPRDTKKTATIESMIENIWAVNFNRDLSAFTDLLYDEESKPRTMEIVANPAELDQAAEITRQHRELISDIESAALMKGDCRQATDFQFEEGSYENLAVVALSDAADLMRVRAWCCVLQSNRHDAAHRATLATFGLANSLRYEVKLETQLRRLAIYQVAIRTMCELLPYADWSNEQIRELMAAFDDGDWANSHHRTWLAMRVFHND